MSDKRKILSPLLVSIIVLVIGTISVWRETLGFHAYTWESYRRLNVLLHPIDMPNVQLQDQDGRLFTPAVYKGKLLLVNFIYTRCPDLCTFSGAVYGSLLRMLAQDKREDQVQLLSISLDPDYDSPAHLREYRSRYIHETTTAWRVARPWPVQGGTNLLKQFGVVSIPDGLGGIKHNAAIHLVDRQGRLVRILSENNHAQIMSAIHEQLQAEH